MAAPKPASAFQLWMRRRKAREALRAGDPWVCPYCREVHPAFEVGGTKFGFGYPSARLGCCGKAAFMLKDPKTQELRRFVRIGEGDTEWMPKEAYFAWVQEQAKPRGHRESSPHLEVVAKGIVQDVAALRPRKVEAVEAVPPPADAPAPPGPAPAATFVPLAKVADIPEGGAKVVEAKGQRIALFRMGEAVTALADACCHSGTSLASGILEDGVVTCSGHGWRFDARTGACENRPDKAQRAYAVRVESGQVLVGV